MHIIWGVNATTQIQVATTNYAKAMFMGCISSLADARNIVHTWQPLGHLLLCQSVLGAPTSLSDTSNMPHVPLWFSGLSFCSCTGRQMFSCGIAEFCNEPINNTNWTLSLHSLTSFSVSHSFSLYSIYNMPCPLPWQLQRYRIDIFGIELPQTSMVILCYISSFKDQ